MTERVCFPRAERNGSAVEVHVGKADTLPGRDELCERRVEVK